MPSSMSQPFRNWLLKGFVLAGLLLGGWLLYRVASQYTVSGIAQSLRMMRWPNIVLSLAFAMASYTCLTLNDWIALRYVGKPLAYRRAALAAFVGLSLGHSIGFAGFSSGPIRYRFYSRWGLDAVDVAKLVLFCGVTVAMGLLSSGAAILILGPGIAAPALRLPVESLKLAGIGLAGVVAAYIALTFAVKRKIVILGRALALPAPHLAIAQIALGIADFACVAACLDAALSSVVPVSYTQVATALAVGNSATLLTHAPGGLGVIETAVTFLVPHRGETLGGGLLVFRLIYYLLPLLVGLAILVIAEIFFRAAKVRKSVGPASQKALAGQPGSYRIRENRDLHP
jgi:uncharacterized membrane protein YbhN (UPF0104 family)